MNGTDEGIQAIASAAAQWVVESGMEYGQAKQRAARDLGRRQGGRAKLPPDEMVEQAVREYLSLYCAHSQPAELAILRGIAREWMQKLSAFRPHLGGAVWRGTATRHSAIFIDLYADDAKALHIDLLNQGLRFEVEGQGGGGPDDLEVFTLYSPWPQDSAAVPIHLLVHPYDHLRGALQPDASGRSWRGDLRALLALMEDA